MTFLVPVYKGKGMNEGEMGPRIAAQFPDSTVITVYNGVTADEVPELPSPYKPVWSSPGLRSALEAGYAAYTKDGTTQPLVRTDSDEHPIERFEELADEAFQTNHLVVGNLTYGERPDLMPTGSADEAAQRIWEVMYGQATCDRAIVGCAHGLLVFPSPDVCKTILEHAKPVLEMVDLEAGQKVQWGHDGLMILAAVAAGIRVKVVPIRATEPRNRPSAKIADQFKAHYAIVKMAERLYPRVLG